MLIARERERERERGTSLIKKQYKNTENTV